MKCKFQNNLVFSIEKQLQRPRILIIALLQRNNKSALYPYLSSPLIKAYYIFLWLSTKTSLRNSPFSTNDFLFEITMGTHALHTTIITSTIINCWLCTKLMSCQEDICFHFLVSSSIRSAKMLLQLCLFISISSLGLWRPCICDILYDKYNCYILIQFENLKLNKTLLQNSE